MDREAYLVALNRLSHGGIKSPTLADLEAITPHLTDEQRRSILHDDRGVHFAIPPVRIIGGFWVASYTKSKYSGINWLNLEVVWYTPKSCMDVRSRLKEPVDVAFRDRSMTYAEEYWGDQLIPIAGKDAGIVFIQDPTNLYTSGNKARRGSPKTMSVIYYTLSRRMEDILIDYSAPLSEVWNNGLVEVTCDYIVGTELAGHRGGYRDYNCAFCSYGLGRTSCKNCGNKFYDDYGVRSSCSTPLPERMVALLQENGHRFGLDPAIARQREWQEWEEKLRERELLKQLS